MFLNSRRSLYNTASVHLFLIYTLENIFLRNFLMLFVLILTFDLLHLLIISSCFHVLFVHSMLDFLLILSTLLLDSPPDIYKNITNYGYILDLSLSYHFFLNVCLFSLNDYTYLRSSFYSTPRQLLALLINCSYLPKILSIMMISILILFIYS